MKRRWVQHKTEDAKVHGDGWIIAEEREWDGEFVYATDYFAGLASDFAQIGEYVLDHDEIQALRQQVEELTKDLNIAVHLIECSLRGPLNSYEAARADRYIQERKQRQAKIMEEMIAEDAHLLDDDTK